MIRNIVFDVGMVLVDFCWQRVMENLGFTEEMTEKVADATVHSRFWGEYDRSSMSDEDILAGMIGLAPKLEREIRLFWDHVGESIHKYPYTEEWIKEWKRKGYGCYILSNYPRRTYQLTKEELSFEELMDGVLFSYQVQQVKPEAAIYESLLSKFQLIPKECVFLDDNPDNVEAARRLGMCGIVFTGKGEAEAELKKLGVK